MFPPYETDPQVFHEGISVYARWDGYPVTSLHALILPKRRIASWFDASDEEVSDLLATVFRVREQIRASDPTVTGFNLGINDGGSAGQTVMHAHLHLIPRRDGDVENPRGGVRGVIPAKQNYEVTL